MELARILRGIEWRPAGVDLAADISMPATDSRSIRKNGLFICLRGTQRNGHTYAKDACAAGAAAVVCEEYLDGLPCILVDDTRHAASVIWNNWFGNPADGLRFVGITGTNGKTSTAAYLDSILSEAGYKTGLIGTLGCYYMGEEIPCRGAEIEDVPAAMTTPDPEYLYGTIAKMKEMGAESVVMEVSSHSLMLKKTEPLYFECGIFTNLSPEHLDFHGDMESYFKVKAGMFTRCATAVINTDDEYGRRLKCLLAGTTITVPSEKKEAHDLSVSERGVRYKIHLGNGDVNIFSSVTGDFTVYNTMLAAKAAYNMGVDPRSIQKGIEAVTGIPGRMERVVFSDISGFDVFIDYAHTPAALESAINTLRNIVNDRKITVLFGCGGDRDREKRPAMGALSERLANKVIVTSDNPRTEKREDIISDILTGMTDETKRTVICDRREAIRYAILSAQDGEIILLAGKGHETYETDITGKHPFSEKAVVLAALEERGR